MYDCKLSHRSKNRNDFPKNPFFSLSETAAFLKNTFHDFFINGEETNIHLSLFYN